MDFSFNEEQKLLKESLEKFIEREYTWEQRKTYLAKPGGFSREV